MQRHTSICFLIAGVVILGVRTVHSAETLTEACGEQPSSWIIPAVRVEPGARCHRGLDEVGIEGKTGLPVTEGNEIRVVPVSAFRHLWFDETGVVSEAVAARRYRTACTRRDHCHAFIHHPHGGRRLAVP